MHARPPVRRRLLTVAAALTLAVTGACSAEDPDATAGHDQSHQEHVEIPEQEVDKELQERLPDDIQESGQLVSVNSGSFPPYEIIETGQPPTGASADLLTALGELWGIEITHETVDGLTSTLTGLGSERYQLAFGPIGDFKERQAESDFIDYVQEYVVFAVPAGNPEGIGSLADTCGLQIAVQAGGSAEAVIKEQSKTCEAEGQEPVQVMSFKDQPQSILSVRSGRADAFFSSQAPLTYFVEEAGGELELAGVGESNGFDTLYQGAIVPKDSDLGPLIEDSLQVLFDNGTYEAVMKKWNLEDNMIDEPGMNRAVS
jgi:polar amino acid transport system substrate-binding protein